MVFFRLGPALCPRETQYFFTRRIIFSPQHRTWSTAQLQLSILCNINLQEPSHHYIYHHIQQSDVHWVRSCFFDLWTVCLLRGANEIFTYSSVSFSSLNRPCGYSFPSHRGGPLSIQKQSMRFFFLWKQSHIDISPSTSAFPFQLVPSVASCSCLHLDSLLSERHAGSFRYRGSIDRKILRIVFPLKGQAVSWHSSLITNCLEQDTSFFFRSWHLRIQSRNYLHFVGPKIHSSVHKGPPVFYPESDESSPRGTVVFVQDSF